MAGDAPTLQEVISRRLREVRAPALRQDDLAAGMRRYGFNWTGATVAAIETGRRNVSLEEATALPLVLGCELTDLLLDKDIPKVALNERGAVLREAIAAIYTHEVAEAPDDELKALLRADRPDLDEDVELARKEAGLRDEGMIGVWIGEARRQEAERKAARALKVSTSHVAAYALRLWGRSLTEERDARLVDTDYVAASEQAVKGHITRQLLTEMRELIADPETLATEHDPLELTGIDPKWREQMRHIPVARFKELVDEVIEYGNRKREEAEEREEER